MISETSVTIESIAGEPRRKDAGLFLRAAVKVHFLDERELGSTVALDVFAPFDPAKPMEEFRAAVLVEAERVIRLASGLLKTKSPA